MHPIRTLLLGPIFCVSVFSCITASASPLGNGSVDVSWEGRSSGTVEETVSKLLKRESRRLVPSFVPLRNPNPDATHSGPPAQTTLPISVLTRRELHDCDGAKKQIEAQAWEDAFQLAKVAAEWKPDSTWQDAMTYFMGKNSKDDDYKYKITRGLDNEVDAHKPNSVFPESVIHVYCKPPKTPKGMSELCRLQKHPVTGEWVTAYATSWVVKGYFWNTYNIVFCQRFFNEKTSLAETFAKMERKEIDPTDASVLKLTWAHTYYHELMHLDPLVAVKETWDPAYDACECERLARDRGCKKGSWKAANGKKWDTSTLLNADSWAMFASVAYFQKALSTKAPARAHNCGKKASTLASAGSSESNPLLVEGISWGTFDAKAPNRDIAALKSFLGYDPTLKQRPPTPKDGMPAPPPPVPPIPYPLKPTNPSSPECKNVPSGCSAKPPRCIPLCSRDSEWIRARYGGREEFRRLDDYGMEDLGALFGQPSIRHGRMAA
ncbi:hypothetical protein MMC30_004798 [Trapelia coarctata]|nr:hypothetical protein [Trapelia coarctata]